MRNKNPHLSHLLEINLAVIFISTSGTLGRYIDLPVPVTIASRGILAFFILLLFCRWKGISLKVKRSDLPLVILSGILMALHWVTYFYALQMSSVAIGMLSIYTYPIITAFLEPLLLKTKFQKYICFWPCSSSLESIFLPRSSAWKIPIQWPLVLGFCRPYFMR